MKKFLCLFLLSQITMSWSQTQSAESDLNNSLGEEELYRPNFHFTPEQNWMNDPNGMFFYEGQYHLFFQHYPDGNTWGPMHWGHATTENLIEWDEKPIAIYPDEQGYIFSGSAVVDANNTSGLAEEGKTPIVAMFTYHDAKGEKEGLETFQSQAIAYSLDQGKTWKKYEGNPVIENPGIRDFRDPKMQWDELNNQWIMVLAAQDKSLFYTSKNLTEWELAFEFGNKIGAHGGVWECPDFFPIQVKNSNETKWVLIQSLNPGAYNGGSGTQYFVGDFDGTNFTPVVGQKNLEANHTYWLDFGKDNYAGVTWASTNMKEDRKLFIGWMSNWQYAEKVPTTKWRSSMTFPRELTLIKKEDSTYRLFSEPANQIDKISKQEGEESKVKSAENTLLLADDSKLEMDKLRVKLKIPISENETYTFKLTNLKGDILEFGFHSTDSTLFIDRSRSGIVDFSNHFADKVSKAPRTSDDDLLEVEILLDKTSIELFYDEGETVMTEIFFPNSPMTQLELITSEDNFTIEDLNIYQLELN